MSTTPEPDSAKLTLEEVTEALVERDYQRCLVDEPYLRELIRRHWEMTNEARRRRYLATKELDLIDALNALLYKPFYRRVEE